MKLGLGILFLLLAGCATPARPVPGARTGSGWSDLPLPKLASLSEIRVGVELLAVEPSRDGGGEVSPAGPTQAEPPPAQAVAAPAPDDAAARLRAAVADGGSFWLNPERIGRRDLDVVPDTAERMTLRFMRELVGPERERLATAIGWSHLLRAGAAFDVDENWADGARLAVEQEAMQGMALGLLRRPFRHALRELPLVRGIELEIEDFKAHNVPTSAAYLDSRATDDSASGRVSFRWRHNDGSDPVAVTWSRRGWRFGLSRETVRTGYSAPLSEDLALHVSTVFDHLRDRLDAEAEIRIDLATHTWLRLRAASQFDAFPGPDLAREVEGQRDGGPGLSVYIETIF